MNRAQGETPLTMPKRFDVTDFKIVWNNSGINTVCPLCGDRTEPSINFQVQAKNGDDICETCLLEHATDLAEVLYAYFLYKYPGNKMTTMFLEDIKKKKMEKFAEPKTLNATEYQQIKELTDAASVKTRFNNINFLVSTKWLLKNYPDFGDYVATFEEVYTQKMETPLTPWSFLTQLRDKNFMIKR